MAWDASVPDGTLTAKDNGPGFIGNWQYIETELQDDHYFDEDAGKDGRHKHVSMPKKVSDPAVPANTDGILYFLDNVSTSPYFRNAGGIMELLGIRAVAEFTGRGTNGNCTLNYSYNVTSVARSATGVHTATFTTALPNANYLVLGGAIRNSSTASAELIFEVRASDATPPATKAVGSMSFQTNSDGGTGHDPNRGWFVCFGG